MESLKPETSLYVKRLCVYRFSTCPCLSSLVVLTFRFIHTRSGVVAPHVVSGTLHDLAHPPAVAGRLVAEEVIRAQLLVLLRNINEKLLNSSRLKNRTGCSNLMLGQCKKCRGRFFLWRAFFSFPFFIKGTPTGWKVSTRKGQNSCMK